jgi:hypothetical protein
MLNFKFTAFNALGGKSNQTGSSLAAGSGKLQGRCVQGHTSFDTTILCTLLAAVRQQAPAGRRAAARRGLACFDTTILCTLRAAVRQQAPASCRAEARRAHLHRHHHPLHSAGRCPAAGPSGCRAATRRGLPAPTPASSALCGPPSGMAPAGRRSVARGGLTGFDTTMLHHLRAAVRQPASACCSQALRAAVRQPAPAGCRAAARGELAGFDNTIFCRLLGAVRRLIPAGCRAVARGWLTGFDNITFCTLRSTVRKPA